MNHRPLHRNNHIQNHPVVHKPSDGLHVSIAGSQVSSALKPNMPSYWSPGLPLLSQAIRSPPLCGGGGGRRGRFQALLPPLPPYLEGAVGGPQ